MRFYQLAFPEKLRHSRQKYRRSEKGKITNRRALKADAEKVKAVVLAHYGGKCRCGFSDSRALSIDHVAGNGRSHLRSLKLNGGRAFYRWLIRNAFPKGFRVLCMNCQWIKRFQHNEHNLQKNTTATMNKGNLTNEILV